MERKKLAADEILSNLAEMEDWHAENDILSKRFEFANFAESLEFVNLVGAIAGTQKGGGIQKRSACPAVG